MATLSQEDKVTLSYAKQSGNALMRDMVELVERLSTKIDKLEDEILDLTEE